jgi:hypothetical protein
MSVRRYYSDWFSRVRKYFFRIWFRGAVILNYGSGSSRQMNYGTTPGSGSYLDIFVTIKENIVKEVRTGTLVNPKNDKILNFYLKFLQIYKYCSKDADPDMQFRFKDPDSGGHLNMD